MAPYSKTLKTLYGPPYIRAQTLNMQKYVSVGILSFHHSVFVLFCFVLVSSTCSCTSAMMVKQSVGAQPSLCLQQSRINHHLSAKVRRDAPSRPQRRHQTRSPCPPASCFPWRDRDGFESGDWPPVLLLSVESILITAATGS